MTLPKIGPDDLVVSPGTLYIGAFGFEDRAYAWPKLARSGEIVRSIIFNYLHPKGQNQRRPLKTALRRHGRGEMTLVDYDVAKPEGVEGELQGILPEHLIGVNEVVVDISAMTKFLILLVLFALSHFKGRLRIVYASAKYYPPSKEKYESIKANMRVLASFPSQGAESIIRAESLGSIRMQGQPTVLVAFASFNEQLVRHVLGTIAPHRLLFINGRPPARDYAWRESATQAIHQKLIDEFPIGNERDTRGALLRVSSTLHYGETVDCFRDIYREFGLHYRIMCEATGSKCQTVGLFVAKCMFPDMHVEYPTPDTYFRVGWPQGVGRVYAIRFRNFSSLVEGLGESGMQFAASANAKQHAKPDLDWY